MKVLHVIPSLNFGGIEQYLLNLIDHIDKGKFEIEVLCVGYSNLTQAPELTEKRGIILHYFTSTNIFARINQWIKLLKSKQYDIIHIQGMPNLGALYLLTGKYIVKKTKWISHAHMGYRELAAKNRLKALAKNCCHPIINLLYQKLTDVRAGCTHQAMQLHFGKSIEKNGLLLNNGINLSRFRSFREIKATTRDLICVAHISAIKNPFFLIEVMEHLTARNRAWHLTWVGEGIMENEVRRVISEKGMEKYITMLGARKDIPELLKQHSFFLLASLYEAMPLTIIEAQASGCVCISSTAPPIEAECGALIRLPLELGAEAWSNKIEELYENQTEMRIDEARLSQFDIKKTAHEIEKLYDSLVL